ncbi:hypothetical protein M569_08184, partial [Genlisea aurea]
SNNGWIPIPAPFCFLRRFQIGIRTLASESIGRNSRSSFQVGDPTRKSGSNGGSSEKLPYVHVRARRGQATGNHSLAERARREKINARMKLLQELVPGCNKISGTALVLDGIINHVQDLQRQVEFLSMRLAAVDPRIDFNLDHLIAAESAVAIDSSNGGVFSLPIWPENEISLMTRQHHQCQ